MSKVSRRLLLLGLAGVFAAVLTIGPAAAGDQAINVAGSVMCGKCTLNKADLKDCQDMLVVKEGGATTEYYLAKNDVLEKFGHTCKGEKKVKAAGTVAEKDGKKWLTLTSIEEMKG